MFHVNWFSKKVAIDLGTANTLVYVPHEGIVTNEPSIVAIDDREKKIVAIGRRASDMSGKVPDYIRFIQPLKNGVIADFSMAGVMLKHFLKGAIRQRRLLSPKIVITVPFGISEIEKNAIRDSVSQVGARRVITLAEPMAAAIGVGMPIQTLSSKMIVNIGGGTTSVAVISFAGIISGSSVKIAGGSLDEVILQYIRQKYNLLVGPKTAERIKITIGSASPLPVERVIEVRGCDLARGLPGTCTVSSEEIREALGGAVFAIINVIKRTLEETPPEIAANLTKEGMVLTGGGALLKNLDDRIRKEIGVPVALAAEPLTSVVMGAGKAMAESALLKKIAVAL